MTDLPEVLENCSSAEALILDARSTVRFYAEAPEPRPGLQGGHIPGSKSLPFTELVENDALGMINLVDRVLKQVVEHTPVSNHHDTVKEP